MTPDQAALWDRLHSFRVDEGTEALTFVRRLARENDWSPEYTERVFEEYKRFAFLAMCAGHPVTPSDQVDQVWHLHLTYTRSYWDEFCANVLRAPLHHNPTKGGKAEGAKFDSWYNNTLDSYRRLFNEEPPVDIWPAAEVRFGRDLHFKRINTARNWVIPKPTLRRSGSLAAVLFGVLLIAGCAQAGLGQPVGWWGLSFAGLIGLYLAGLVVVSLIAWRWRRSLSESPTEDVYADAEPLTLYELAYLAGGERRVFETATVKLAESGILYYHEDEPGIIRQGLPLPKDAPIPEQRIYDQVGRAEEGIDINYLWRQIAGRFDYHFDHLRDRGLIRSGLQRFTIVFWPSLLMLAYVAGGILLGVQAAFKGANLETLISYFLIVAVAGLIPMWVLVFRLPSKTTPLGEKVLARQRHEVRDPRREAQVDEEMAPANDPAETVAMMGLAALHGTMLMSLGDDLAASEQQDDAGADGGGCGDGGCGDAGCGGCGGCG